MVKVRVWVWVSGQGLVRAWFRVRVRVGVSFLPSPFSCLTAVSFFV
jgi:hypothetical protein